jgi:hypothetical protein
MSAAAEFLGDLLEVDELRPERSAIESERSNDDDCFAHNFHPSAWYSGNSQNSLNMLQRNSLGFGKKFPNQDTLQQHHGGKKGKGMPTRLLRNNRKHPTDDGTPHPMREATQRLTLRAYSVGEDFAEEDPNYGSLREGKKGNIAHETGEHQATTAMLVKAKGRDGQAHRHADGANHEQSFATKIIDHCHCQRGG